jgi:hypothetical protein
VSSTLGCSLRFSRLAWQLLFAGSTSSSSSKLVARQLLFAGNARIAAAAAAAAGFAWLPARIRQHVLKHSWQLQRCLPDAGCAPSSQGVYIKHVVLVAQASCLCRLTYFCL